MQNLNKMLGMVQAKYTQEIQKAENSVTKKEDTFFDNQRQMQWEDPDNTPYLKAIEIGKLQAKHFISTIHDSSHPEHEQNFAKFKNEYGMDARKCQDAFIENYCAVSKVAPYSHEDKAYEQHLIRKYKPQGEVTSEVLAFYKNFSKALEDKWSKVGYVGDRTFVEAYTSKYGLKEQPNELRDFQPKE